jgi:hypothetical protein
MARTNTPPPARSAARRRLRVVDNRDLCLVCDRHRAQQLGMCTPCLDAFADLSVFDQQVEQIRRGGRP